MNGGGNPNLSDSISVDSNYKHQYGTNGFYAETIYRKEFMEGRKRCSRTKGEPESESATNKVLASLQI